jgi:hypothetical protein
MAIWVNKRTDIPNRLAQGIGRIMVEWSYVEWQFEENLRLLLQTDITRGRLATHGANLRRRGDATVYLCRISPATKPLVAEADELRNTAGDLQSRRDLLAHGMFGRIKGSWFVLRTSGVRTLVKEKVSRAELPQMEKIDDKAVAAIRRGIKRLRADLDAFQEKLVAALPQSPHVRPSELRQGPIPPDRLKTSKRRGTP